MICLALNIICNSFSSFRNKNQALEHTSKTNDLMWNNTNTTNTWDRLLQKTLIACDFPENYNHAYLELY